MCKFNPKNDSRRIDPCMNNLIEFIQKHTRWETVSCCCGHGKYPPTLLVKQNTKFPYEIFSGLAIPREFKFYKKDEHGYYYIPEVKQKIIEEIKDDEANRCVCCNKKLPKNLSPMQMRCNKCDREDN